MTTHHLFAYGTLQVPAIIQHIVGRPLAGVAAALPGYARYRVAGRVYPAVVEAVGAEVVGTLYAGLDAAELERLDYYEGDLYERREVDVSAGRISARATTYVLRPELRHHLSDEPWDMARFRREHLADYLALVSQTSRAP